MKAIITKTRAFLAGKKTYLISALMIFYSLGIQRKWWPSEVEIWGLLGSSAAITIRVAIARMLKQFLDDMTIASATPPSP
jgi:hypothetical protein